MPPNVLVNKDGGRWAVRREGTEPPISTHPGLEEALSSARQLAAQGGVDVIWEDEGGQTQRESHDIE